MNETVDKRRVAELRSLLRTIEEAGWEYARVEIDGVTLVVSSNSDLDSTEVAAPAPESATQATPTPEVDAPPAAPEPPTSQTAAAPAPSVPSVPSEGPAQTVTSPTIGLFWRSPKPSAPPFVEVGATVAAGDTVCIIEVMKLMTHVAAPVAGTVRAIHIDNGSMVEHGTALLDIAPHDTAEAHGE